MVERIGYAEHAIKRVVFGSGGAIEWIGHDDSTAAVLVDCRGDFTRPVDRLSHATDSIVGPPGIRVDAACIVSRGHHSSIQIVVELLRSALTLPSRTHLRRQFAERVVEVNNDAVLSIDLLHQAPGAVVFVRADLVEARVRQRR